MKHLVWVFVVSLCLVGCNKVPCQKDIDLKPMYGRVQKCDQQLDLEEKFLASCDSTYSSRQEASLDMLRFAWKHYASQDNDKAMKRFNQAWLLDSLNADVYRGFGELLVDKGEFSQSIEYFDKAIELDPNASMAYKSLGLSYNLLFDETKDQQYLDKSLQNLKHSLNLNPNDASVSILLTEVYIEKNEQDSAEKYLDIAQKSNPDLIKEELRNKVSSK